MKRLFTLAITIAVCCASQAQEKKEYPKPEPMRPGMSEYWTPQPKVVTPGDIKTNTAPNDAIVLFDGKDLSAWMNSDVFSKRPVTPKCQLSPAYRSEGATSTSWR